MGLKGSQIEIVITEQEYGGKAVGYYQEHRVVTSQGIMGQRVLAKIKRVRSSHLEAVTMEILKKSDLETELPCPHFERCGGCTMQGVPYEAQITMKEKQVKDLFCKHDIKHVDWLKTIDSKKTFGYRNKMEFSFGNEYKGGPLTLGMHQRGRRYDVVDTPGCNIVDEDFRSIRTATADFFREKQVLPYHKISHEGILRHLVIRKASFTGEIMVNLVTTDSPELPVQEWKHQLLGLKTQGTISGVLWTHNDNIADTVQSDHTEVLFGKPAIQEKLLGLTFTITPFSFFQTNSYGAEKLYESLLEWVDESDLKIYDLYCGLGTITQLLAREAACVTGIELVEEAVNQAREDADANGLENCVFIAGDVKEIIDELLGAPDLLVVDPPRPGVHGSAMKDLLAMNPHKFIYVSCNPKTLIENLKQAIMEGWQINEARCVDLFPHTPHMEVIVMLTKPDKRDDSNIQNAYVSYV